jgi:cytochrome c oxidase subunit IV
LLLAMLARTLAGSFSGGYHMPVAVAGLYWSFVDIVWVFLFAIFYLRGLHSWGWGAMAEPVLSKKAYLFTYLILLALTLLTVGLAYIPMGAGSMAIAIIIATVQAFLIASFFMQALFEFMLVRVAVAVGIVWLLIMMTLTLTDYITRGWLGVPGK